MREVVTQLNSDLRGARRETAKIKAQFDEEKCRMREAKVVATILQNELVWVKSFLVDSRDATFKAWWTKRGMPDDIIACTARYAGFTDQVDIQRMMIDYATASVARMAAASHAGGAAAPQGSSSKKKQRKQQRRGGEERQRAYWRDVTAMVNRRAAALLREDLGAQDTLAQLHRVTDELAATKAKYEQKVQESRTVHVLALQLARRREFARYNAVFARLSRTMLLLRELREGLLLKEGDGGDPRVALDAFAAALEGIDNCDASDDDRAILTATMSAHTPTKKPPSGGARAVDTFEPSWEGARLGADVLAEFDALGEKERASMLARVHKTAERERECVQALMVRAYGTQPGDAPAPGRLEAVRAEAIRKVERGDDPDAAYLEFVNLCKKEKLLDGTAIALLIEEEHQQRRPRTPAELVAFLKTVSEFMCAPGVQVRHESGDPDEPCKLFYDELESAASTIFDEEQLKAASKGTDAASGHATPAPRASSSSP